VDIAEAGTFDELVELLDRGGDVDLVLLDLAMPGVRGFSGLMYMRAQYPGVPAIVVSANDDPPPYADAWNLARPGLSPRPLVLMLCGLRFRVYWVGTCGRRRTLILRLVRTLKRPN
jgi:CheY-like chemotaxis protein